VTLVDTGEKTGGTYYWYDNFGCMGTSCDDWNPQPLRVCLDDFMTHSAYYYTTKIIHVHHDMT